MFDECVKKIVQPISLFWFRRDLRLSDNHALSMALKSKTPVLPIFIFDDDITNELPKDDARITFIYDTLHSLHTTLNKHNSSIYCLQGKPLEVWENLIKEFNIQAVYTNEDYEPYAIDRDEKVKNLLSKNNIPFFLFKDHVIFEKKEVIKKDDNPYTVYTPYKNKWLECFRNYTMPYYQTDNWDNYIKINLPFPSLEKLGFTSSDIKVYDYDISQLDNYDISRNDLQINGTSKLGPHLRFGTVSIRNIVSKMKTNSSFLNQLIWRDFFIQILYHFPYTVHSNFKKKYDNVQWRNNTEEFHKWALGKTGYFLVDAGMRELNTTGYMHNRVRMIVASFLCKSLLIDWRWGEAYFAKKLLDYELASNNGNWQWVASTGCDAVPYFRIFNPLEQTKKFDPNFIYIKKWLPEWNTPEYPTPIVEHKFARQRAIDTYKNGLRNEI